MKWPWTKKPPPKSSQLPAFGNILIDAERDDETLLAISDYRGKGRVDFACLERLANQGFVSVMVAITTAGAERVRRLTMPVQANG